MATKNIVPNADGEGQLGTSSKSWAQGHIDSITGTIATAAQGSITSLGTLTTLTVDNVIVNGTTIGHTSDTDLLTLASGVLTVAGNIAIPNDGTIGSAGTANAISITSSGEVEFTGANHISGASSLRAQAKSGTLFLDTSADAQIRTNGTTTALTLDTSQNATLVGTLTVSGAGNSAFSGNLFINHTTAELTINNNADSTSGGTLSLENSDTSVADNHESGRIYFYGQNDNTQRTETVLIRGIMTDVSDGTEDSKLELMTQSNGGQITSLTVSNDVTVGAGNLVIGTSGKGIDFSATSNASGSTSEVLDDYVEGSWTPTIVSGGTVGVVVSARYTVIGNMCHFNFYIYNLSITNNSNEFRISLPITPESGDTGDYTGLNLGYSGSFNSSTFLPISHSTAAYLYLHRNSGNANTILNSDVTGLTELIITGWYRV